MYGDTVMTQQPVTFTKLNTFMPSNSTIGIGLSISKKTITFVYENIAENYKLNFSTDMTIMPYIWEANFQNIQDNISVNFGKYPFKYYLPGFVSYQNYLNTKNSCYYYPTYNFHINCACLYAFVV